MPVAMGSRTYLEPRLEPGIHFHRLPDLATIRGNIMSWDPGNPSDEDRKEAREVKFVDDPNGMAAAIVQEVDGMVIAHTVIRGLVTSQEGEAHAMDTAVKYSREATGLLAADLEHVVCGVGDSRAAEGATKAYEEDPWAHCTMCVCV